MPAVKRRRIIGERVMVSEVEVEKGCEVPWHQHENEQIAVLISGRLQFDVATAGGGRRGIIMQPGDVLHLPGNVGHGGTALEDCRVLDIFNPPSEQTGIDRG